jgi:isopenicillin N synthase-like dioxygenase
MYMDTVSGTEVNMDTHSITADGGLYIQARNGHCVRVTIPNDCCAFQIGETGQILSGGLLQATPHAVLVPSSITNTTNNSNAVSRESFALFIEPASDDRLVLPPNVQSIEDCSFQGTTSNVCGLRPLSERYTPGQTFGDFHLATVSAFTTAS